MYTTAQNSVYPISVDTYLRMLLGNNNTSTTTTTSTYHTGCMQEDMCSWRWCYYIYLVYASCGCTRRRSDDPCKRGSFQIVTSCNCRIHTTQGTHVLQCDPERAMRLVVCLFNIHLVKHTGIMLSPSINYLQPFTRPNEKKPPKTQLQK